MMRKSCYSVLFYSWAVGLDARALLIPESTEGDLNLMNFVFDVSQTGGSGWKDLFGQDYSFQPAANLDPQIQDSIQLDKNRPLFPSNDNFNDNFNGGSELLSYSSTADSAANKNTAPSHADVHISTQYCDGVYAPHGKLQSMASCGY